MIGRGCRLAALAVTAQIRGDDREVPGKERRDLVPHHMRLRMSMQEKNGRTIASMPYADRCFTSIHHRQLESFKHRSLFSLERCGNISGEWISACFSSVFFFVFL